MRLFTLMTCAVVVGGSVYAIRLQAPPNEIEAIRTIVSEWHETLHSEHSAPLANAVLMSSPSDCALSEKPEFISEGLFTAFLDVNGSDARPIRLSSLADLVAIVSFQEARRWQRRVELVDIGDRALVEISRVGFFEGQAIVCVNTALLGSLIVLKAGGPEWSVIADHPVWFRHPA